ncbi:hypothetical protein ElyMa_001130400 [Elysia marginata]|uniref:Uncharacterized protein n=1 Tax=Elysia marginata TaxID=1093978 RepID=A0AAV4HZ55_9GAST|nr:hypothetical protein ElyMa_001130400 [Elysia marginata]
MILWHQFVNTWAGRPGTENVSVHPNLLATLVRLAPVEDTTKRPADQPGKLTIAYIGMRKEQIEELQIVVVVVVVVVVVIVVVSIFEFRGLNTKTLRSRLSELEGVPY